MLADSLNNAKTKEELIDALIVLKRQIDKNFPLISNLSSEEQLSYAYLDRIIRKPETARVENNLYKIVFKTLNNLSTKINQIKIKEYKMADKTYIIEDSGLDYTIDGVEINTDVFQNGMAEYALVTRESKIDDLKYWIREKHDKNPQCSEYILNLILSGENKVLVNNELYDGETYDSKLQDIRDVIDNDGNMMLDELIELNNLDYNLDDYILSSINTNKYLSVSKTPEKFNDAIADILKANEEISDAELTASLKAYNQKEESKKVSTTLTQS